MFPFEGRMELLGVTLSNSWLQYRILATTVADMARILLLLKNPSIQSYFTPIAQLEGDIKSGPSGLHVVLSAA